VSCLFSQALREKDRPHPAAGGILPRLPDGPFQVNSPNITADALGFDKKLAPAVRVLPQDAYPGPSR
jgi:hypothetical protein